MRRKRQEHLPDANRMLSLETEIMTKERPSSLYKRTLRQVDNSLFNAICDLLPYYGLLLRADPVLGAVCERLIQRWEDDRADVHFIYRAAWQCDHIQFQTIGEAAKVIAKERTFKRKGEQLCRDYSAHWDRLVAESSKLLERRARASVQLLGSLRDKLESSNPRQ